MRFAKVNCVATDTFTNVWKKAFSELSVLEEQSPSHTDDLARRPVERTLDQYMNLSAHVGPGEVRKILRQASQEDFELVIVFDEFDRLHEEDRHLFADTIKDLSDNSVNTTLVLVGVARDVVELIEEHASIDRCVVQILMPPMTRAELRDIITRALDALKMTIDENAAELIVSLSQGLPHYTHLIGQESASTAIDADRLGITADDVNNGIKEAIGKVDQSLRSDYLRAAQGQRRGTLFPHVLLACALADVDELGYFSSTDVRGPLCDLTGEEYDIPNFSQHLDKFTDPARGPVLEKWGTARRFRFRFRNPLLRPFVLMKGLTDGAISGTLFGRIRQRSTPNGNVGTP